MCIATLTLQNAVSACPLECFHNLPVCAQNAQGTNTKTIGSCDLTNLRDCTPNPEGWHQISNKACPSYSK